MKKQILLVDDDLSFRERVREYLSWHDLEIDCEDNFLSAQRKLNDNSYDLLILNALTSDAEFQNAFHFAQDLRKKDRSFSSIAVLIIGHDDATVYEWKGIELLNAFYMNKFEGMEKWLEKIGAAIYAQRAIDHQVPDSAGKGRSG